MKFTIILVSSVICFFIARMINENWLFLTTVFRGTIWLVAAVLTTSVLLATLLTFDALKRRRDVNQSADDADIATNNQVQAEAIQQTALANERQLLADAWAGFELNQAQLELQLRALMAAVGIDQARRGQSVITDIGGLFEGPRPSAQTINHLLGDGNEDQNEIRRLTTLATDLATFKPQNAPQIRVISGMGGGKSTLLHSMTDETNANVLLVQTHEQIHSQDYAGYGDRVKVIGMSPKLGDPNAMDTANAKACDHIVKMRNVIKSRYAQNTRTPTLLILDEWVDICLWAVQYERDDAIIALREMSTSKARKAGVGIVLASQTDRATVSGFKGLADILKQMTEVRLYKDGDDRWATVKHFGGELVEYEAAPPHPIVLRQEQRKDTESAAMPQISLADELEAATMWADDDYQVPGAFLDESEPELTNERLRAMNVYQDMIENPGTVSRRQATQDAFGEGKFGQTYLDKLYRLWADLNLDVSAPQFK